MSNSTISPNMNLIIPTVGVDPGPDWANNVNASLSILDQHNHSGNSGVPVNPAGININSDLPFNSNNATLLRSARFSVQASPLALATDIGCIYVSGVDLYYNDISGNKIKLTAGGTVNATSSGISSGTATASFISSVLVVNAASNTPANIQAASILFGNNVSGSKYVTVSPVNSLSTNYNLVLPTLPAVQSIMTLDASGNITAPYTVDSSSIIVSSNVIEVGPQGVTQAMLALRATGSTVAAGGYATSSSSGSFSSTSTSFTAVTGLSVTITTTGRPVRLQLGSAGSLATVGTTNSDPVSFQFVRGVSTVVSLMGFCNQTNGASLAMLLPPSAFQGTDFPTAGTYTYTVQVKAVEGTDTITVTNCQLEAYEL
jgi:hypothetical protein